MFTLIPAFRYGWQQMQKHIWAFLAFTLLLTASDIWGGLQLKAANIGEIMMMENVLELIPAQVMVWMGLLSLGIIVVNFFIVTLVLSFLRGIAPVTYLKTKIKHFPAYLGLMFLKYLAIAIGLTAFIVPGLFFLLALYFAEYLLIDKDMKIMASLKASWVLTKGFRAGIFFFEVNVFVITYLLSFPQSLWPDTVPTYAILALLNVMWLPVVWNAAGHIYEFVSREHQKTDAQ